MPKTKPYIKYTFNNYNGYLAAPWLPDATQDVVAIRHSAGVNPWRDDSVHLHESSEEFYFLRSGKYWLWVGEELVSLQPNEFLQVRAGVPHAVVRGEGLIEYFVLLFPPIDDKQALGELPRNLPQPLQEEGRGLVKQWGCRVSIEERANRDCWLFGVGQAKLHSPHMCLAYMRYPTQEDTDRYGTSYHHCYHAHLESWEFYTVLRGVKVLRVDDEIVPVVAGEILAVHPGAKHIFHEMVAPFEGFTFRTPLLEDKVEYS